MSLPQETRKTVGGMQFGDHLCLLYDHDYERRAILVAYIRDGLRADHKIIYVSDTDGADGILAFLNQDPDAAGLDLAGAMERGQLVVRTAEEAYIATGRFDPDQILGLFATDIDLAMVQGYAGVRATGEATWTLRGWPGSERFAEFEQKVDDAFRTSEINAMSICQYDRRWFSAKPLQTLLHTHLAQVRVDDVYDDGILRIAPTWTPPGLALYGAIEECTFHGLTEALSTIGEKTGHICLELGGVEFCDMAGLRTLLGANTSDHGFERQLLLRNCPQYLQGLLKLALWESIPGVVVEES